MRPTKNQRSWNQEVVRESKPVEKAKRWLKGVERYPLSWDDQARVRRAQSYIELALTEIYSMMYPTAEEVRRYKLHEIP